MSKGGNARAAQALAPRVALSIFIKLAKYHNFSSFLSAVSLEDLFISNFSLFYQKEVLWERYSEQMVFADLLINTR